MSANGSVLVTNASMWTPVIPIHDALMRPSIKRTETYTLSKQYSKIYEKSEAGRNFLQKIFLKNCFLEILYICFLLAFFILIPRFHPISNISDLPSPNAFFVVDSHGHLNYGKLIVHQNTWRAHLLGRNVPLFQSVKPMLLVGLLIELSSLRCLL